MPLFFQHHDAVEDEKEGNDQDGDEDEPTGNDQDLRYVAAGKIQNRHIGRRQCHKKQIGVAIPASVF